MMTKSHLQILWQYENSTNLFFSSYPRVMYQNVYIFLYQIFTMRYLKCLGTKKMKQNKRTIYPNYRYIAQIQVSHYWDCAPTVCTFAIRTWLGSTLHVVIAHLTHFDSPCRSLVIAMTHMVQCLQIWDSKVRFYLLQSEFTKHSLQLQLRFIPFLQFPVLYNAISSTQKQSYLPCKLWTTTLSAWPFIHPKPQGESRFFGPLK